MPVAEFNPQAPDLGSSRWQYPSTASCPTSKPALAWWRCLLLRPKLPVLPRFSG